MQRVRDVTTRQIADEALYRSNHGGGAVTTVTATSPVASSGGSSPNISLAYTGASVDAGTSPYTVLPSDLIVEVDDTVGQCEVIMLAAPAVGPVTIKKVTTSNNSVLVDGGGNLIEDPSNPGTWATSVAITPTPSGASAVTWIFTGTRWDVVGGL